MFSFGTIIFKVCVSQRPNLTPTKLITLSKRPPRGELSAKLGRLLKVTGQLYHNLFLLHIKKPENFFSFF